LYYFLEKTMKKILFLLIAFAGAAFAADGETAKIALNSVSGASVAGYALVGAGIGIGLAALGGAIGMGHTAAATIAGTARNPSLGGKLMTTMFIALAMIEAQVIYTLVIALILLYANPFIG
jgi:F-type H+-transporting ATPase subunit c